MHFKSSRNKLNDEKKQILSRVGIFRGNTNRNILAIRVYLLRSISTVSLSFVYRHFRVRYFYFPIMLGSEFHVDDFHLMG